MTISKELLDELLKGCERPEDLLGDGGLLKDLKIKLMERMLGSELTAHLGYEEGKDALPNQPNRRNCTASKRLKGQDGEVPISVPHDRDGSFEPELVKKGQTRIDGMYDVLRFAGLRGVSGGVVRVPVLLRFAGVARDRARWAIRMAAKTQVVFGAGAIDALASD